MFLSFIFHRNKAVEFQKNKVWWFGVGQNINLGNPERLFISIEIQYDIKILTTDVNLCGRDKFKIFLFTLLDFRSLSS